MTTHYFELHILPEGLPDKDFAPPHVMNQLMHRLHLVLAKEQISDVGVSFPQNRQGEATPITSGQLAKRPKPNLGTVLRLHGTETRLQALHASTWLNDGLKDHLHMGAVAAVPAQVQHRVVARHMVDSNPQKTARRLLRRMDKQADPQKAQATLAALQQTPTGKRLDLPFLSLTSHSTGQPFRLFVYHHPVQPVAHSGTFNSYGLAVRHTANGQENSHVPTIPWW